MTNANDGINPETITIDTNGNVYKSSNYISNEGLTKREYFAAMAMQGLLSNEKVYRDSNLPSVSELSVRQADALINELNK